MSYDEKHFPVKSLTKLGLIRKKCKICGKFFWTFDEKREFCGEHDGYSFILNPVGKKLSYYDVWLEFSKYMKNKGYIELNRYPVVARWRDDLDFVIASITVFQPWVTEGFIDPPSKKLIIPQVCLRFTDVENVGLTGRHFTSFVMIGQHAFVKPDEFNINEYFEELLGFFTDAIKIPMEEFIFHEDKWSGGGNGGTSIEFFVRGLEIANQVYMQYKVINDEWVEMNNLKVLDMGMGMERIAWLTNGTITAYDIVFPNTIKFLLNNLKEEIDLDTLNKIYAYASQFEDINEFKKFILNKFGKDYSKEIDVMKAIYAISDHLRTLYIAISDGALPSNIGGNYNLRFILRRVFLYLDKYFDNISIKEILEKVAEDWYEKNLKENIEEIIDIFEYEREKYSEVKKKAEKLIKKLDNIDGKKLFELYTSEGISPEIIKEYKEDFIIPKEFYSLLEEHKKKSKKIQKEREIYIDVSKYPETYKAFYESWRKYYDIGKLLGIEKEFVILDRSIFYPTKGGQINDTGWIFNIDKLKEFNINILEKVNFPDYVKNELGKYLIGNKSDLNEFEKCYAKVIDVIEYKRIILIKVDRSINWEINSNILQIIDKERRYKISRHHTATHILTAVLRKIYGKHIWQAGAEKDEFEGRLDITHYKVPSLEEIKIIEKEANRIVLEGRKINKFYLRRDEAERKYGFIIYQGGYIPEINLRLIEIEGVDIEACSGTHLDNTLEIGLIKIIGVEKIADGIIRFKFIAGDRIIEEFEKIEEKLKDIKSKYKIDLDNLNNYIERINNEREEINKKYNDLLESFIRENIKNGKIYGKINASVNDVLKFVLKYKNSIEEIELECKDGKISSKEGDKKVDKFYITIKK